MSTATVSGKSRRRRLSPSERYEIYVSVLTGQSTQREAGPVRGGPFDGGHRLPGRQAGRPGRAGGGGAGPARGVPGAGGVGGRPRGDRPVAGDGDRAGGGL